MISDILSDAVSKIESYIDNGKIASYFYQDKDLLEQIIAVTEAMEALRVRLDTPPQINDQIAGTDRE